MTKTLKYKITHEMLAKWFNYNNVQSFNASKARKDMLKGINEVINQVETQLIDKLKS